MAGTIYAGYRLYERWRNEREYNQVMAELFDAHKDDIPTAQFGVGERVIYANPNLRYAENDEVIHAEIEDVAYVSNLGIFAYKLSDMEDDWINESWLKADVYGTATIAIHEEAEEVAEVEKPKETKKSGVATDYWLATLSDAKKKGDAELEAEALAELRKLAE
jgi:hypothetical protein